jgi:hypothetical protein
VDRDGITTHDFVCCVLITISLVPIPMSCHQVVLQCLSSQINQISHRAAQLALTLFSCPGSLPCAVVQCAFKQTPNVAKQPKRIALAHGLYDELTADILLITKYVCARLFVRVCVRCCCTYACLLAFLRACMRACVRALLACLIACVSMCVAASSVALSKAISSCSVFTLVTLSSPSLLSSLLFL